jgi:hypothetical protein
MNKKNILKTSVIFMIIALGIFGLSIALDGAINIEKKSDDVENDYSMEINFKPDAAAYALHEKYWNSYLTKSYI